MDINADKINGMERTISRKATSIEPETMEPIASTKPYKALKKVNAETIKNKIRRRETRSDCLFCFLSKPERRKASRSKNFFIITT